MLREYTQKKLLGALIVAASDACATIKTIIYTNIDNVANVNTASLCCSYAYAPELLPTEKNTYSVGHCTLGYIPNGMVIEPGIAVLKVITQRFTQMPDLDRSVF